MKAMLVFAVVGLIAGSVSAHGGDRRGGDKFGGNWWNGCTCPSWYNRCANNNGTKNLACLSRVQYIGCQDTTCSVHDCPANSLYNSTSGECVPCATGFHVDQYNRTCVCDQGTTYNRTAKACVACPINAVVTADYCGCQNSVLDRTANTCKDCPAGSTRRGKTCQCTDPTQFWNAGAFACQGCPGVWQNKAVGSVRRPKVIAICNCTGQNQFFNKDSVACVTCPANSVAVAAGREREGGYCKCTALTEVYDITTNTCVAWADKNLGSSSSEDDSWGFGWGLGWGY